MGGDGLMESFALGVGGSEHDVELKKWLHQLFGACNGALGDSLSWKTLPLGDNSTLMLRIGGTTYLV